MAEPLKASYGIEVAQRIAAQLSIASPSFDQARFLGVVRPGYEVLEFMARARRIAEAMRQCLPDDFLQAADIVEASLGAGNSQTGDWGLTVFDYAPHGYWVADHAFEATSDSECDFRQFDRGMQFQHALTQRFTAEFSIRRFISANPDRALRFFEQWVSDPNPHVRRLVSEGLRPRLPWAGRLTVFADDPAPVLRLLTRLRDDPSEYVRRSVANHLNDLGKDQCDLLLHTAREWLKSEAPASRQALVKHALRSLIKQGHPDALGLMGYGPAPELKMLEASLTPARLPIGAKLQIKLVLRAPPGQPCLIDFRVHYRKANGSSNIKVFKWTECVAPQDGLMRLQRSLSFEQRTTRVHYPGKHQLELLVNGTVLPIGAVELEAA